MLSDLLIPSCLAIQNNSIFKNWRHQYEYNNTEFVNQNYDNQQSSSSLTTPTNQQVNKNQSNDELNNYFNNKNMDAKNYYNDYVRNTVAQAVIARLHLWCCQLFWLTIVCVMGCCGELQKSKSKIKTIAEVRRNIFNNSLRRCKDLKDLEVQLLRHLTNPQSHSMVNRPLHSSVLRRRQHLSRPPSPQLFAIDESEESNY